jgi:hypothetical protein
VNFFTQKLIKIKWSSLFFGSFAPHFQIKLSIHASNFNSRFVNMSELELFLLTGVLTPNFNTMDLVKIHVQKKKVKKSEKPRFYGQNKLFFENPALQPLGSFSHMTACRSSLESTGKMSLILVFNKNSPRAHTELELGVLGVHGKLVKYVVHSSKRKN